jgi:hypothetical protein
MSNGSSTGLESADAGGAVDPPGRPLVQQPLFKTPEEVEKLIWWLYAQSEWKAAREVEDAFIRWKAREGERRREGVDEEDPRQAEVIDIDPDASGSNVNL